MILETIKKGNRDKLSKCNDYCHSTPDCNGYIYHKDLRECELKGGDVKISGIKENTQSVIFPCP